jgi:hypothetical protein
VIVIPEIPRPSRALAAVVLALASGCSLTSNIDVTDPPVGYTRDSDTVQIVSAVVGGKNVFVPSTVAVVSGRPSVLSVYNGTKAPHGFAIDAAGIQVLLQPGQETRIELPALEGRALHRIYCHLHGAHRPATLLVLP